MIPVRFLNQPVEVCSGSLGGEDSGQDGEGWTGIFDLVPGKEISSIPGRILSRGLLQEKGQLPGV